VLNFLDFNMTRQLHAHKARLRKAGYKIVQFLPYVYAADYLPLTGNTTVQVPVTIDQDSDFLLCQQTFAAFTTAGAAQSAPNILIRYTADAVARQLMSQAVHLANIFGTGERPYIWYQPLELPAKSNLHVEADSETATDLHLRLSFIGVKVYKRAS